MDDDLIWASLFLGLGSLLFVMSILFLVYVYQLVRYLKERHANPFQTISDIFSSVYDVLGDEPQFICGLMWRWCPMKARFGAGFDAVEEVIPFRFRNFVLGIGSIVALMVSANIMAFLAYNEVKDSTWSIVVGVESVINILSLCILYPWRFSKDIADFTPLDAWFCYNSDRHTTKWTCCCCSSLSCMPKSCCCLSWCCLVPNGFRTLHMCGTFLFFVVNPCFNMILNVIKFVYPGRSVALVWAYIVLGSAYFLVVVLFFGYWTKPPVGDSLTVLTKEVISEREKAFWTKLMGLPERNPPNETESPVHTNKPNDPTRLVTGEELETKESELETEEQGTPSATDMSSTTPPRSATTDDVELANIVSGDSEATTPSQSGTGGNNQTEATRTTTDQPTTTAAAAAAAASSSKWPQVCGVSINLVYLELLCICLIIVTNMIDVLVQFYEID